MAIRPRRYAAMPLTVTITDTTGGVSMACAITSPAPAALVMAGAPVTITGTISKAATVIVKLGAVVLGSASVTGLDWSYVWTPQVGDAGTPTISATATPVVGSGAADATGVTVEVWDGNYLSLLLGAGVAGANVLHSAQSDLGVVSSGGVISQWNDQHTTAKNFTATGTQKPAVGPTTNGVPSVQFDGTDDGMSCAFALPTPSAGTPLEVLAIYKVNGPSAADYASIVCSEGSELGIHLVLGSRESRLLGSGAFGYANPNSRDGAPCLAEATFTGSVADQLTIGDAVSKGANSGAPGAKTTRYIGSIAGATPFKGELFFLAHLNVKLSAPQLAKLKAAARLKLGTSVTTSLPAMGNYLDSIVGTVGLSPVSAAPNDYTTGDTFRRLRFTTSATSLQVEAVRATDNTGTRSTVGVWVDGAYFTTLTYSATAGVKQSQTLTLDGQPHTVDLEEQASVTNVTGGTITYVPYAQPDKRVVLFGDSIVYGVGASLYSNAFAAKVRHALPSDYTTTIYGYSGLTLFGAAQGQSRAGQLAARCDGLTKNIIVCNLMVNDWNNGISLANFTTALNTLKAGVLASTPNAKLLLVSSPQSATAGGGAGTLQQYRDVLAAAAGGNVSYLDHANLYTGSTPWGTFTSDGIHPTDAGHALIAASIAAKIQTL